MSSGKWCSTCRSGYRGSFAVHSSTAKHRANARRNAGGGRSHRGDLDRALGFARVNVRRALAGDRGEDQERVRKHRRRRPLDGPGRVVRVRRYFRRKGGGWFTYISASGVVERLRASR